MCAGAAASALALRPRQRASLELMPVHLEQQVPQAFSGWTIDPAVVPVLPDPSLRATLERTYSQVLARTYVDREGRRLMLSIAYGEDQATDATAVHRPEFCYSAQGFAVRTLGEDRLALAQHAIKVRRLVARLGPRMEPITYWVTMNDRTILPGVERKLSQIRLGLSGLIPDGMLVRSSTVGLEVPASFRLQDSFLTAMEQAMPAPVGARYFGHA
nr:exosortase-associated protein EpsI, B-type [Rubrivivax gelatinosus]